MATQSFHPAASINIRPLKDAAIAKGNQF